MNDTNDSDLASTTCIVYAQKFPDPSVSIYSVVPFACVYAAIFVLGVVGNLALIHVTLQHRALQTVQNMFILNLAASDIIVCMLSLPITPVTNIYKNWFFGTVLCRLIPWIQGISVFICTFSLGAIAIDRYVLVVRPHSRPLTRRGALIVTMCLWTLSVIVTLPYAVFMDVVSYDNVCGEFCTERWPNAHSRRAYTLVVLAAQFVVPFTLMAYCYWTIFSRLRDRARTRLRKINERSQALEQSVGYGDEAVALNGNGACGRSAEVTTWLEHQECERQRLLAQTRRTTTILASMVLIFGLSWLPHNVVSLIMEYDNNQTFFTFGGGPDLAYLINLFTHSIAMLNNVANPVLYAWLNPTFREMVVRTFASMKSRGGRGRNRLTSYENASHFNSTSRTPRTRMTTGGGEDTRAAAERAVLRVANTNVAPIPALTTNGHAKGNNCNHLTAPNGAAKVAGNGVPSSHSAPSSIATPIPTPVAATATTTAAPIPATTTTDTTFAMTANPSDSTAINMINTSIIAPPRAYEGATIINGDEIVLQEAELTKPPVKYSISEQPASGLLRNYPIHDDFADDKIAATTITSMPIRQRSLREAIHQTPCKNITELRPANGDSFHYRNHVNPAAEENNF